MMIVVSLIVIILIIVVVLMILKKYQTRETLRLLKQSTTHENFYKEEVEDFDLLFFSSRDSEIVWFPYYLTHTGIALRINGETYVLDADPMLKGVFLVRIDDYIKRYCGHIYYVKPMWSTQQKESMKETLHTYLQTNPVNTLEDNSFFTIIINSLTSKGSCTGLVSDIIYNNKKRYVFPDSILHDIKENIRYVKVIKLEKTSHPSTLRFRTDRIASLRFFLRAFCR
jgi:hypothetical protein